MKRLYAKLLILAFLLPIFLGTNSCSSSEKGVVESIQSNKYSELLTTKLINDYRESKGLNKLEASDLASLLSSDYDKYMISTNIAGYNNDEKAKGKQGVEFGAKNVVENTSFNYDNCSLLIDNYLNNSDIKKNK
ncbi:hypothetical protein [uncultured Flavobacterium sp.]|uniref:hypothetical protein n=1 Tax=uncultured Flavobacterium sp. TaxID=165435 RepID=UPI0030EDFA1C|tara:strand:+ start:201134 stop:201535 length:402 start_codon:yes stop_codon:yes gene_type:complete